MSLDLTAGCIVLLVELKVIMAIEFMKNYLLVKLMICPPVYLAPPPQSCFENHAANCICTHREESAHARDEIKQDLVGKYDPPCN